MVLVGWACRFGLEVMLVGKAGRLWIEGDCQVIRFVGRGWKLGWR